MDDYVKRLFRRKILNLSAAAFILLIGILVEMFIPF